VSTTGGLPGRSQPLGVRRVAAAKNASQSLGLLCRCTMRCRVSARTPSRSSTTAPGRACADEVGTSSLVGTLRLRRGATAGASPSGS
jgi:hypothetical protein